MSKQKYQEFLSRVQIDRRAEIETVWQVIRENMPAGYEEDISSKFLSFRVYNEWYVALANQKNYITLHLLPIYIFPELKARLDRSDKKIKGGKGCLNFKKADELPLEIIGEIIAATASDAYLEHLIKVKNKGETKSK